jgi:hypothetical protein
LRFGFTNGCFTGFSDTGARMIIGDTAVNISREQAIDIAMRALQNYSYDMPGGLKVSDFNVTEIYAYLRSDSAQKSNVLQASWVVEMGLNQTCPGSVHGLRARIWANSGEVERINVIAYLAPETTNSKLAQNISEIGDMETNVVIILSIAIIVFLVAGLVVLRTRKKTKPCGQYA